MSLSDYLCYFENSNIIDCEKQMKFGDWKSVIKKEIILELLKPEELKLPDGFLVHSKNAALSTAITALLCFVQQNFTGPNVNESIEVLLDIEKWPENISARQELIVDGEELNVNVSKPELLLVAKILLEYLAEDFKDDLTISLWTLRLIYAHQKVLDDRTNNLYTKFLAVASLLTTKIYEITCIKTEALILLEITQGYLLFRRVHRADDVLKQVKEILKTELAVTSMLGVRTKFQTKPLPQMALKVQTDASIELSESNKTHSDTNLPKLLKLDDDTRLERIQFIAEDDNKIYELSSILQSLVLTQLQLIQLSQPQDKLLDEEVQPYLTTLLYQNHGPWPIRFMALLINIKLEADHKRTVDRSLKQCEELMKLIRSDETTPISQRLSYIFTSAFCPRWTTENQLGNLMMSLGLIKTALDLFLRIQAYEDAVVCYNMIELRHKAADLIRQEIDKEPTVKLYCLLGDATDDTKCYEKAWELSNFRSGRAQRHWGNYYFAKKEYEEAIPHLQKSLEINSLQEVQWLRLGYAALQLENWELAASAYRRYTHLEPYGFESWNNLAKAYIKLGDKKRAHKIFNEALKCNFNNWMVWENFMLVSLDTGHFEDVLNAYKRLMELKEKYCDKEVLGIVVNAIAKEIPDHKGEPSSLYRKKATQLLSQICIQFGNDGAFWEMAAQLCPSENHLSKAQKLQSAFRGYTQQQKSWAKDSESCLKVLTLSIKLCQESLSAFEHHQETEKTLAVSQLSSARLSAQACIKVAFAEKHEQCEELISELQILYEKITEELKKCKN